MSKITCYKRKAYNLASRLSCFRERQKVRYRDEYQWEHFNMKTQFKNSTKWPRELERRSKITPVACNDFQSRQVQRWNIQTSQIRQLLRSHYRVLELAMTINRQEKRFNSLWSVTCPLTMSTTFKNLSNCSPDSSCHHTMTNHRPQSW